jgi:thymidylate kinase
MGLYALDVHSLCRAVRAIRRKKPGAGVILCDRFIYDELANLKPDNAFTRLFVATMLRLAPTPDLSLVLDADPDAAFARKPEYPLEFLHSNRNAYLNLARVASLTVIPAAPIDEAHAEILRHIQQKRTTATSFDDAEQTLNREHLCCADTADQRP